MVTLTMIVQLSVLGWLAWQWYKKRKAEVEQ